jgi:hypothetical protein
MRTAIVTFISGYHPEHGGSAGKHACCYPRAAPHAPCKSPLGIYRECCGELYRSPTL